MGKKYLFEKILNKKTDEDDDSEDYSQDENEESDVEDSDDSFDADSDLDSDDAEIQRSFAAGELKPGIHTLNAYKRTETLVNDEAGLKQKLQDLEIYKDSWLERLDLVNDPAPVTPGLVEQFGDLDMKMNRKGEISGEEATDSQHDFKREMLFYRQAQASALDGLKKLKHQFGIHQTSPPEDYFAEMIKSDAQMKKVRDRLETKQNAIEASEKARKMRELKKYGKKVQQEVQIKRQKEKKEMLQKIKNYKKGKEDNLDFLDDKKAGNKKGPPKGQKEDKKDQKKVTKKQKYKESRYGYGGQKKRSKYNNSDSAADVSSYSARKHGKPRANKKANRPGKARRANMRSRK